MSPSRWADLMTALQLPASDDTYQSLVTSHAEEHRFYHNGDHVAACLRHLDDVDHLAERPHEIELALWFHDAVYDPFSSTNERDSADWAVKFLQDTAAGPGLMVRIDALIMVTFGHAETKSADEDLMIDIDLSILGETPEIYSGFETAIRQEYAHVPREIFNAKRAEILAGFLDRGRIYNSAYFKDKFERQARINLSWAITALAEREA